MAGGVAGVANAILSSPLELLKLRLQVVQIIQGDPKKMSHSVLQLKSVVGVQSYFFRGVSESEFRARSN